MLRQYLKTFQKDISEQAQFAVYNCLQMIDYAHNGDMSYEDFSGLDLRKCSLAGTVNTGAIFTDAYIDIGVFFMNPHKTGVNSISLSSDGKHIITGDIDTIKIWDYITGRQLHTIQKNSFGFQNNVKLTKDGGKIISVSGTAIEIHDATVDIFPLISKFNCSTGNRMTFSRNEKFIAFTRRYWEKDDNKITWEQINVANINDGRILFEFDDKIGYRKEGEESCKRFDDVYISFSLDNKYLLVAYDGKIKIIDSNSGSQLRQFSGHLDDIRYASYTPCGKYVVVASSKREGEWGETQPLTVHIWESSTCKLIQKIVTDFRYASVDLCSCDGGTLIMLSGKMIAGNDTAVVYKIGSSTSVCTFEDVLSANFSHDGKFVITQIKNSNDIELWSVDKERLVKVCDVIIPIAYSKVILGWDNKSIITVDVFSFTSDCGISKFDISTGRAVRIFGGHSKLSASVHSSPHSRTKISDNKNADHGEEKLLLQVFKKIGAERNINNGNYDLPKAVNGIIKVYSTVSEKLIRCVDGEEGRYSPNGQFFLYWPNHKGSMSYDSYHAIEILNGVTGELLYTIKKDEDDSFIAHAYFSQNRKLLVVESGGNVDIHNAYSGEMISSVTGQGSFFSPDEKYIIARDFNVIMWSEEEVLRVYEVSSGKIVTPSSLKFEKSTKFSDDSRFILSDDGVWEIGNSGVIIELYQADLRGVKHDDLSEQDILRLKQNGAIVEGVEPSC